ncbi:MAG: hypothetical protein SGI91_01895 [Alphaproteobacteria bacterium]|nr:hypothetical protein [Alphaproteobacteria bacterium]
MVQPRDDEKTAAATGGVEVRVGSVAALKASYQANVDNAQKLSRLVAEQLEHLLEPQGVTLAAPIECRVKSWTSTEDKVVRKALDLNSILALEDFVGVRAMLLFRQHLRVADEILKANFDVVSSEDVSARLSETQFGYQSLHYVVRLREGWLTVPTMAAFAEFRIEVQIRTLAQHVWAAASHKLQYKHEESVPPPLRRSLHRVSALLETVDLELERVFEQRREYQEKDPSTRDPRERLNVDLVRATMLELLPAANKADDEDYADLLPDLFHFKVETVADLRKLLEENKAAILQTEDEGLKQALALRNSTPDSRKRYESGVFFTHAGLVRVALRTQFGTDAVTEWLIQRMETPSG